jgi:hypothetical protein
MITVSVFNLAKRFSVYFIVGVVLLSLHGCGFSKTQLVKIENGEKPTVGVLLSVNDKITVECIGFTVFNNKYIQYPSPSNTKQEIEVVVNSLLSNSDRVSYVNTPLAGSELLSEKISKKPNASAKNNLTDSEIYDVAEWGKARQLDYVVLIFSNVTNSPVYGRPGSPTGKGILSDMARNYLYLAYKALLIDTETAEITDYSGLTTFKEIPRFTKRLSQKDIERVTKDWEYGRDNDLLDKDEDLALKEMMVEASFFNSKDYTTLDTKQLSILDKDLHSILERNIKRQLIGIGLIDGDKSHSRFDMIKPKEKLYSKAYKFH